MIPAGLKIHGRCFYFNLLRSIVISIGLISCTQPSSTDKKNLKEFNLIEKIKILDQGLPAIQPGDWLYEHKETGQTFENYLLICPVTPNKIRKNIYLQPIGTFNAEQDSMIRYTSNYLELFFNLKTIILDKVSDTLITKNNRRIREDGSEQFLTTFILDSLLPAKIPNDGIVIMAITANDLYPKESWNYVFGQAYTKKRMGVSSMFRYYESGKEYQVCLKRLIKTSSHEIGHMFSMLHCTNAVCAMNGTNNLAETDSKPNRLCSVCLKKLYWNLEFNNIDRLTKLKSFFLKHNLNDDYNLVSRDLKYMIH